MSKYYTVPKIQIGSVEEESASVLDDLRALKEVRNKYKAPEISEDDSAPVFSMSQLKKANKGNKKKKKKKTIDSSELGLMSNINVSLGDSTDSDDTQEQEGPVAVIREGGFLSSEILDDDYDDYSITDKVLRDTKKNHKKNKKKDNDYEKQFADELAILYELLDEIALFGKGLEKKYKGIESSKVRGVSKYTNDLILSIITSKKSKLDVIKEITSIKKTIADLTLKAAKENKEKDAGATTTREELAASYLSRIYRQGLSEVRRNLEEGGGTYNLDDQTSGYEYDDNSSEQISRESFMSNMDEEDDEILFDRIRDRLDTEKNPFRSPDADAYIKYENSGVVIKVKKCVDNGEWEFIAIDKWGNILDDYPTPTKRTAGKMKWSSDGNLVTDSRGISYKVIEYYSDDEDE